MSLNKTASLAVFVASITILNTAHAATNAQVTITGQIATATCDLSVTKNNIELGAFASSEIATSGVITHSAKNFTLNLTHYTKASTGAINLLARGTALAANNHYFNNQNGATVGVELKAGLTGSAPVLPYVSTDVITITGILSGAAPDNYATIPMTASLFSTVAIPTSQLIEAPITFSIAYN